MAGVWLRCTASRVVFILIAFITPITYFCVFNNPVKFRWSSRLLNFMNLLSPVKSLSLSIASIAILRYYMALFLPKESKNWCVYEDKEWFQLISRFLRVLLLSTILHNASKPFSPRLSFGINRTCNWFSTWLNVWTSGAIELSLDLQSTRAS